MSTHKSIPPKKIRGRLNQMDADPEKIAGRFCEILRRLGFPCFQHYLKILLSPGLLVEDYRYLTRLLRPHALPKHMCDELVDSQPTLKIQDFDGEVLFRLQPIGAELFLHRSPRFFRERREVSFLTCPDSMSKRGSSLDGFLQTAYGSKVPIPRLEAGIALLVKVLPLSGIRSSMSCAGHIHSDHISAPRIYLFGQYHLAYLRHIMTTCFGEYSIAKTWTFTHTPGPTSTRRKNFDPDWASGLFQAHADWVDASLESRRSYAHVLDDLHAIAKRMMDPHLAAHFRSIKNDWARDYHRRFVESGKPQTEDLERIAG